MHYRQKISWFTCIPELVFTMFSNNTFNIWSKRRIYYVMLNVVLLTFCGKIQMWFWIRVYTTEYIMTQYYVSSTYVYYYYCMGTIYTPANKKVWTGQGSHGHGSEYLESERERELRYQSLARNKGVEILDTNCRSTIC